MIIIKIIYGVFVKAPLHGMTPLQGMQSLDAFAAQKGKSLPVWAKKTQALLLALSSLGRYVI